MKKIIVVLIVFLANIQCCLTRSTVNTTKRRIPNIDQTIDAQHETLFNNKEKQRADHATATSFYLKNVIDKINNQVTKKTISFAVASTVVMLVSRYYLGLKVTKTPQALYGKSTVVTLATNILLKLVVMAAYLNLRLEPFLKPLKNIFYYNLCNQYAFFRTVPGVRIYQTIFRIVEATLPTLHMYGYV